MKRQVRFIWDIPSQRWLIFGSYVSVDQLTAWMDSREDLFPPDDLIEVMDDAGSVTVMNSPK